MHIWLGKVKVSSSASASHAPLGKSFIIKSPLDLHIVKSRGLQLHWAVQTFKCDKCKCDVRLCGKGACTLSKTLLWIKIKIELNTLCMKTVSLIASACSALVSFIHCDILPTQSSQPPHIVYPLVFFIPPCFEHRCWFLFISLSLMIVILLTTLQLLHCCSPAWSQSPHITKQKLSYRMYTRCVHWFSLSSSVCKPVDPVMFFDKIQKFEPLSCPI